MIEITSGTLKTQVKEAVLFAFDDFSLPFRRNLVMHLIPGKKMSKPRIVLGKGPPGSHDEGVHYYGTTIRIGDEFRMWHVGRVGVDERMINLEGFQGRLCYAVSRDGVNWEKPSLGLVEYKGSKDNNLLDFPQDIDLHAAVVLYDPEDPDPNRRFKMNYEPCNRGLAMSVAYSPDGLHWTPSSRNPVGPRLEHAGLIKWNGCYYVNGQGPGHPGPMRALHTYASYDFEHWTEASVLGLQRSPLLEGPTTEDRTLTGEEVHLGAALHHRGNVILGIYGQWHGHPTGDRRYVAMDLGFLISHDAMHFHEPIRDFRFIAGREEQGSTLGYGPSLAQGQGMENVGDKTLYWYALWRIDGQVRLATWDRDRFGYVTPCQPNPNDYRKGSQLITCPLQSHAGQAEAFLNISGLGEYASVRVEVLDEAFRPVNGYSGDEAAVVRESGLRVPVRWPNGEGLPKTGQPMHLALHFGPVGPECIRPEDIRLYAIYVQ